MITETQLPWGASTRASAPTLSAMVLLWLDLEPDEADGSAQVSQDQTLWQRCREQPNSEKDRKDIALKCQIADVLLHTSFLTLSWAAL